VSQPLKTLRLTGTSFACLFAAVCLFARPADAAVVADFNGDGVIDAIDISRSPETRLVVRVSGAAPQVLKVAGRLISIVAVDVDRDGHLDITALSERRGLVIWINRGGRGRFSVLKRRHVPHGVTLSRSRLPSVSDHDHERPAAQSSPDGSNLVAHVAWAYLGVLPTPGAYALPLKHTVASAHLNSGIGSRAPPSPI
jgi:hypothetical protein